MEKILIIHHSQAAIVKKMAYAIKRGIKKVGDFEVIIKSAKRGNEEDLKTASAIAIGTPDYFDYMAGSVKDFFDRTFFAVQSKIKGSLTANLPCVFFISGGVGDEFVLESLKSICSAFKFNIIDYVYSGPRLTEEVLEKCEQLGIKLAEKVEEKKEIEL